LLTAKTSPATSASDLNPEVPDVATGWYNPQANHRMAARFEVDNNLVAPFGTGDDKTTFKKGQFGGHADTRARWTSVAGGTFKIDYLGYNARNQDTAQRGEPARQGKLLVEHLNSSGAVVNTIDSRLITGGVEDGYDKAYVGKATVTLAANESIQVGINDGDWSGYDMTVSVVGTTPGRLTAAVQGADVVISWTGDGALQQTDSLTPPNWQNVTPAPTGKSITVPAAGTSRYYRLRQ
jgi:hypothetical protein